MKKEIKNITNYGVDNNIIITTNENENDYTPPKVRITKQDIEAVFENEDGGAN